MKRYRIEATCPKHLSIALKIIHLHKEKVGYRIETEINEKSKMIYVILIEGETKMLDLMMHEYKVMIS